jgi:Na+-driven multidrug efflux pump
LLQVTVVGILIGYVEILFGHELCSIFIDPTDTAREAILEAAQLRLWVMLGTYFACGIMEVMSGYLRGLGHSIVTMICSLTGACLLRIVWVSFIFPLEPFNNPVGLYMSYPVTWVITVLAMLIFAVYYDKKDCNKSKL